uniref:EGF-like domain-containing protein n=1 Tax=Ascaris lumbricoides TaxID=6252 RepID=A0A0M3I4M5_ASCLU
MNGCVHGNEINGRCLCEQNFVGHHCEKKMHCANFERFSNGECIGCEIGWYGDYCELIECVHGSAITNSQSCECIPPYSGERCNSLKTTDIFSYYNHKVLVLGPLGALSLIPLLAILYGCKYKAQRRQVRRIEEMLVDQNVNANRDRLIKLLGAERSHMMSHIVH